MSARGTVAVFAKPPRPGLAKTRLIPALGAEGAAALAQAFLADALDTARAARVGRVVLATTELDRAALGVGPRAACWLQGEGDLGARMARILARACAEGPWGIALGADAPALPAALLRDAARALAEVDAVLSPTPDGGYALLGLRRVPEGLLDGLPWSTAGTLDATVSRLRERGLSVWLLPPSFDVDEPDDLVGLRRFLAAHPEAAPRTRAALEGLGRLRPVGLSVIIPTWQEADRIAATCRATLAIPGVDELVVADADSPDGTAEAALAVPGVRVVRGARGRGPQLNAGAAAADGEILLFLHADCRLPPDAGALVRAALADPEVVGGAFKLWTVPDDGPRPSAWWLHLADVRSRTTRHPYGDQALFCRREVFRAAGGFPPIPIMEDYALSRALWAHGRLVRVDARVTASGRRFQRGALYYCALMNAFPALYRAGVAPERLARWYRDER